MTEDQVQQTVKDALGVYLTGLAQGGAPYSPDPAAWQSQAGKISTAAVAVYRDQGTPPSPVQGADPAETLSHQVQQSNLVAGVPNAVDQQISTVLVAAGVVAATALLTPDAPEWSGLIATVGSNVYLLAAAFGAEVAAVATGAVTKEWKAKDDAKTRPSHRIADGQTVPIGVPFIVGGFNLRYPHDPLGPPQETYNCRCTLRYGR